MWSRREVEYIGFPWLPYELPKMNRASQVAQVVKNLPAIQETWVQSLGREDPLEKGMATHSSILAWETPWTEWAVEFKRALEALKAKLR